jgi:hypothetical protein
VNKQKQLSTAFKDITSKNICLAFVAFQAGTIFNPESKFRTSPLRLVFLLKFNAHLFLPA